MHINPLSNTYLSKVIHFPNTKRLAFSLISSISKANEESNILIYLLININLVPIKPISNTYLSKVTHFPNTKRLAFSLISSISKANEEINILIYFSNTNSSLISSISKANDEHIRSYLLANKYQPCTY